MERKAVTLILAITTVVFIVFCIVMLPDNVLIQVGFDGKPGTYSPKPLAILVPTILCVAGTFFYHRSQNGILISYVVLACSGFLVYCMLLAINVL